MLELPVGSFLPIKLEARASEIGEELADLAGHRELELSGRLAQGRDSLASCGYAGI